ncbi:C40 family peptidase [Phytohabitans flavus]|uniref:C40 family peptidase n=1 Tax=Phytohabitans flavus TaxID=1076124 RepID=UPI0036332EDA
MARSSRSSGSSTRSRRRSRPRKPLAEVKERNSAQLAVIEREREAQEAKLSEGFLNADNIAGMAADPRAIKAVNFALGELGKPYVWGTEGPNTYDCSGLMWAAYRYAGYQLPRVSRDQYAATRSRSVSTSAMLPGDLVFFSSNGTASGIHHVGMYLGEGRMVHAPNSREKVKVSTVWYSRLFAATRIYGAVPAPDLPPTAPPTNPRPRRRRPPPTRPRRRRPPPRRRRRRRPPRRASRPRRRRPRLRPRQGSRPPHRRARPHHAGGTAPDDADADARPAESPGRGAVVRAPGDQHQRSRPGHYRGPARCARFVRLFRRSEHGWLTGLSA